MKDDTLKLMIVLKSITAFATTPEERRRAADALRMKRSNGSSKEYRNGLKSQMFEFVTLDGVDNI
jgi:hypothetical protein